ncbi:hypothetical protein GCM10027426_06450 [Microbacterium lacusdiani]
MIPSSRHVVDHVRHANLRLIASPAPISDTITQTSVMCSASSGCAIGSGSGRPGKSAKAPMPAATNTMGMDTGTLPSRRGRSAATKVAMLAARYSRPTGSNAIPPSSSRWRAGASTGDVACVCARACLTNSSAAR